MANSGASSSAVQNAEYFFVGPHGGPGNTTCYRPTATHVGVTATFSWNVTWSSYLGANCTGGASSAASYDIYIVGNFHTATAPYYLITPVSPAKTVDAFAIGCGGPYSKTGTSSFSVTTPGVTVVGGTNYDFYTAIWVYTQTQDHLTNASTASNFAGVDWSASFASMTCSCP
jgi:hypothetical protein